MALSLIFSVVVGLASAQGLSVQQPIGLTFSQNTYGPDGPWNALSINAGGNPVDLYPGVCGYTIVIAQQGAAQDAMRGGTYNTQQNAGLSNGPSTLLQTQGSGWSMNGSFYSNSLSVGGGVGNASGITYLAGNPTARNSTRELPLGFLDVGFPQSNFTVDGCSRTAGYNCSTSTSPPTYYQQSGRISSSSFGMTLGSAALGIPGSFHYGGYDLSRIVGPIGVMPLAPVPGNAGLTRASATAGMSTVWHDFFQTSLQQIGIRTVVGGSAIAAAGNMSGVLPQNSPALSVQFDPSSPYLYLPRQVCDSLAAPLPVSFNSTLNLYMWNTSSPDYSNIVRSPTVLSLTLGSQGNSSITINVPFSLLNLTLVAPLVNQPTSYFPCQPTNASISVLGRAILQATYLGANWQPDTPNGVFFFGQAPGPQMQQAQPTGIAAPATTFASGTGSFADSWGSQWSPIPTSPGSGGLSAGAAAGIGVGVALGVLAIFGGLATWFLLRRRKRKANAAAEAAAAAKEAETYAKHAPGAPSPGMAPPAYKTSEGPAELGQQEVVEIGKGPERFEVDAAAGKDAVFEAPGSQTQAVEADAGQARVFAELE